MHRHMTAIINGLKKLPGTQGSAVTIGKFDGVHRGHEELIRHTVAVARKKGLRSVVITFRTRYEDVHFPHPLPRLFPFEETVKRIKAHKPDLIVVIDFSPAFGRMVPDEFFQKLIECYRVEAIAVGKDFRFGRNAQGTASMLARFASTRKGKRIQVRIFPFLTYRKKKIATSAVRKAVLEGDMTAAERMLGVPFYYSGTIEKGKGIGRTIGFPTANLKPRDGVVVPRYGVYLTAVRVGTSRIMKALTFVGRSHLHPSVLIETHIIDFNRTVYGRSMDVFFLRYLRPVLPVRSIDALKSLIENDVHTARRIRIRSDLCR